ncbi:MAG TPA: hypothetical protein VEK06_03955, partial [Myxococcota bacterium]|nr:hypothetical protein [Myxococcota bacterium]
VDDFTSVFNTLSLLQQQQGLFLPQERVRGFIDPSAQISPKTHVGRAYIAGGVIIHTGAYIDDDVFIDEGAVINPGVVIHGPSHIGRYSIIGSNSVIGSKAFVPYKEKTLESLGGTFIGEEVEIGALCTIDRGLIGNTRIMNKSRLDNMVHCGHDAYVGRDVAIAAQSGLAGFAKLCDGVSVGGQSGVGPQVVIGTGARLSGKSFAHRDIKSWEIWSGNPALPHSQYLRAYARDKRYKKGLNNDS